MAQKNSKIPQQHIEKSVQRAKIDILILYIIRLHLVAFLALIPYALVSLTSTMQPILFYVLFFFMGILQLTINTVVLWLALDKDKTSQDVYLYENTIAGRHTESPFFRKSYWVDLALPYGEHEKVNVDKAAFENFKDNTPVTVVVGKHSKRPLDVLEVGDNS